MVRRRLALLAVVLMVTLTAAFPWGRLWCALYPGKALQGDWHLVGQPSRESHFRVAQIWTFEAPDKLVSSDGT